MSAGTPAPEEAASPIDLEFSGEVVGRMTGVQVEGTLCAAPRHIISAILTGDVGGEPVSLQIIVNYPAGDSQALVAMGLPLTGPVPTPGPFGGDPGLSSYAGRVVLAPDGRSASMTADLAHGGLPVVEHVTGQQPPGTSHTAESAYAAGLVDAVLAPGEELAWIGGMLGLADRPLRVPRSRPTAFGTGEIRPSAASGWQAVQLSRSVTRPSGLEWAAALTSSWSDLHGRDPAIRAGLATVGARRAVVIAMDRHARANGAARPGPAAFRLAQRALSLAAQLSLPILTIVDTPGAEPGPAAEADGIAVEIARTLRDMAAAPTPTVAICVGEGGSGGAMALAYADRLIMLDDSVFSVMSPEAAAAVLGRDPGRESELAEELRLTARELLRLGVADEVLPNAGPDVVDLVRGRVLAALDAVPAGNRTLRADRATRVWLQTAPERIDLAG